ncbi:MAG: hypothetical protein AAGF24_06465 [Cyanobacteria bacterium P01_H01_bin.121]
MTNHSSDRLETVIQQLALVSEQLMELRLTIADQAKVAGQQAESIKQQTAIAQQQAESVAKLSTIVEQLLARN